MSMDAPVAARRGVRRHLVAGLVLLAASFPLSSCTTVGAGEGTAPPTRPDVEPDRPVPSLGGAWTGFLSVDGENLDGTLEIQQTGSELTMVLVAPGFDLTASGTGRVGRGGDITADLRYETQCPGVARLRGSLEADGLAISGPLTVEDCTGSASGTFLFNR